MSHGGQTCHNHDCSEHECGNAFSLYKQIDLTHVRALNESVPASCQTVFKPWEQRHDTEKFMESNDDDPEIIVHIPFTSDVRIRSIAIIGGGDGSAPSNVRAFTNRDDIDFAIANELSPVQEWSLADDVSGNLEYPAKPSRFQGVASLTLHFTANFGADRTRICFIGLKGDATNVNRRGVASVVYEAMPNPSDHKLPTDTGAQSYLQS